MKKFVKLFALAIMLILGVQTMAQNKIRGTMFLGASFPMKDYADFDGFDDFALTSDDDEAGAEIGFNAGLKWNFNVGVEGLGVMLSIDGFYNGPCSELKTAYHKDEGSSVVLDGFIGESFSYKATPKYINIPAMLGMNYMFRVNSQLAFYAEAGAGGNLRFITEKESVAKGKLLNMETTVKDTQNYDKAFSFAYQAGVGVEVAKRLVIGCSFYDLGKAEVCGEQTIKRTVNNGDTNTTTNYNTYGTIHPIMILGRIGFSF